MYPVIFISPPHTWGKSWANCLARRFAQPFPHVCGEIVVRNLPHEAVSIKSNMFDIFGLARQIPQCVRPSWESSWPWFNQASNKNTSHTHVTPAVQDGVGGRNSDVTEVTWECRVFLLDASLTKLNSILTMAAHNEELASRGEKYQTCLIFFLTGSRGQFLTKSSPHTVRKRLSKPPREAVCSGLSSPCAAGYREDPSEQTAS